MNQEEKEKLTALLRSAFPPVGDHGLRGDLWPRMQGRLNHRPTRMAWFDFALAGVAAAGFIAFPAVIPWVLFQC
ncbi:MAG: hypothetical protein NTW28_17175 [Candidatus Solibacter sp.]|nr:hypothetical protein [Candidatus Solibacter sp.]